MGFGFRKSMSLGGLGRVNFSGRGIGVSTGIKGLRVGVNSRGTYVSGGAGGFYFRENMSSNSRQGGQNNQGESGQGTASGSEKGCLMAIYLITTFILGAIAFHFRGPLSIGLFALFAGAGAFVAISEYYTSALKKKITEAIEDAITNNTPLPQETIEKMKKLSAPARESVALQAYIMLCENVAKDYVIDENERKLIREISAFLSFEQKIKVNELAAAAVISEVVKDNEVSSHEEGLLHQMIESFQMTQATIDQIHNVINSYRQKKEIESKPLSMKPVTLATIQKLDKCYHECTAQEFKQRSKKNEKFFHPGACAKFDQKERPDPVRWCAPVGSAELSRCSRFPYIERIRMATKINAFFLLI